MCPNTRHRTIRHGEGTIIPIYILLSGYISCYVFQSSATSIPKDYTWQSIGLHPSQRRTSRVVAIMVNHELPLLNWSPCTSGCMLPMELVKAILDEIQNDYLALQACALTCHAWSIIAQQHIFRALDILIHLDCWKPRWLFLTPSIHISPKALSFRKLIEAKPQLGSYVETLTFTIHFDHWFYRSIPELLLDVAYFSSSTFWRRQLPHFVKRLSHVKDICFRGSVQHPLAPMLPRVLIDVFSTILHSSFLTTASISHGSTFGILAECHALENLDIWGVSFYDIDFQQVSFPAHPRILSSLSLRSSVSDYVRFLQSDNIRRIFDLGHLKHLRIQLLGLFVDFAESVVPETENLLRRNKESLEYWICNVCLDEPLFDLVDSFRLLGARFSSFHNSAFMRPHTSQAPDAWAKWLNRSFLNLPPSDVMLRRFTLEMDKFKRLDDLWASKMKWTRLDEQLSITRSVLEVIVGRETRHTLTDRDEVAGQDVVDVFPIMASMGRLRILAIDDDIFLS